MSQIVVNDQQVAMIKQAQCAVDVVDYQGNLVGFITPVADDAELAKWRQRLAFDEPTFTTAEVLAHLRSLGS
ncbi:MAG TPA: hypothetical protein VFI31_21360 [Pirellulales bacterium]|nr:hypothetical protein [Pirellulales bacterium]